MPPAITSSDGPDDPPRGEAARREALGGGVAVIGKERLALV